MTDLTDLADPRGLPGPTPRPEVDRVPRVFVTDEGPVMVEGPVEVVMEDGSIVRSERAIVALCTCRRSKFAPFCDTSHRTKVRAERLERPGRPDAAEARP